MSDIFDALKKDKKETKNLKSWAVKLPEDTIDTLEKLYESSGLRYKNEFMDSIVQAYKLHVAKEGNGEKSVLHPDVIKASQGEIVELNRINNQIQSLYLSLLERQSTLQYRYEALEKENTLLKQTASNSAINDYFLKKTKQKMKNRLLTGTNGSGKTYAVKQEIMKAIKENRKVIILDLEGEFKALTEEADGIIINGEKDKLNPFEFYSMEGESQKLTDKIMSICSFVEILIEEGSPSKRKVILDSIEQTYNRFGYTRNGQQEQSTFPTLKDLEKVLLESGQIGIDIADKLDPYINGLRNQFNGQRNITIPTTSVITFDIYSVHQRMKKAVVYASLEYIHMMVQGNLLDDALIVIDGGYIIYETNQISRLLMDMMRDSNEKTEEYILTTQSIAVLYDRKKEILSYIDTIIYFRQSLVDRNIIRDNFLLEDESIINILESVRTGECVVKNRDGNQFFMRFPTVERF